jgi:hypothetical protein
MKIVNRIQRFMLLMKVIIAIVVTCPVFVGCHSTLLGSDEEPKMEKYVGIWQLDAVMGSQVDSIERKQRLILRADSMYSVTFSLSALTTHDTSRILRPMTGKWYPTRWKDEISIYYYYGIVFYPDLADSSVRYTRDWRYIHGGVSEKTMHFSSYEGGTPDLSWILLE